MKALASLLILGAVVHAAPSHTTLQPADLAANSFFGYSASQSGNLLAVGAPRFKAGQNVGLGSVYIFQRTGGGAWVQQAKLQSPVATFDDWFGMGVALDGNVLLVGAPHAGTTGQAFEFRLVNGAWQLQQTLLPAPTERLFGQTVTLNRSTLAVAAGAINTSSVYVFTREQSAWSAPVRLFPLDPGGVSDTEGFGRSIAIQDNTMVIGAPYSLVNTVSQGIAYVYAKRNGAWTQDAVLAPPAGSGSLLYGWSVALSGSRVVIGSPLGNHGGAVFAYNLASGAWTPAFTLDTTSAGVPAGSNFGQAVSLLVDTLLVGAPSFPGGAASTFALTGNTWTKTLQQAPGTGTFQALFGQTLLQPDNNLTIIASPGWSTETEPLKGLVDIYQK